MWAIVITHNICVRLTASVQWKINDCLSTSNAQNPLHQFPHSKSVPSWQLLRNTSITQTSL